jgi:hypothetical protein
LDSFTFVVVGRVVVEVAVDVMVVDVPVDILPVVDDPIVDVPVVDIPVVDLPVVDLPAVDVLVVNNSVDVSVVVETTSACAVGASDTVMVVLGVGASVGSASFLVATSSGGAAMVSGGSAVVAAVFGGVCGRVSDLPKAIVMRLVATLVALTRIRLDAALQRCPPQHRMIQLRVLCTPAGHKFYCFQKLREICFVLLTQSGSKMNKIL